MDRQETEYYRHIRGETVTRLLLRYLALEGTNKIFGIPGKPIQHIMDEIQRRPEEFQYIICRHEGGAEPEARPIFHINAAGRESYLTWAVKAPCELVAALLARNGLSGSDVTLISHQSSRGLLESWSRAIGPADHLDTQARFGNLTLASIPVTLAARYEEIRTRYVVLLGLGIQHHVRALLLGRG